MHRYDDPELAGLVEIWACNSRSSFHRRPSSRSFVSGYVVDVSRGILSFSGSFVLFFFFRLAGLARSGVVRSGEVSGVCLCCVL